MSLPPLGWRNTKTSVASALDAFKKERPDVTVTK
jgi:hypothetical protein